MVDDQPSSSSTSGPGRYLKVGDDLFVHLPGASSRAPAEGEVFDGEVLAATGLEVVDEPGVGGDGSPEEQLFRAMGANFRKLQALYRVRLDKVKSRMATVDQAEVDFKARVAETQTWFHQTREEQRALQEELAKRNVELTMKMADIEKAQEKAANLAAAAEAVRNQHQAALDSQEEDLTVREAKLAAALRGKDEELEALVTRGTRELEQRHKEALDAQALAHAGKVRELEVAQDELKEQALKLSNEKSTLNSALVEAQGAVISRAGELSEAQNSVRDLKLKLEDLEKMLSESRAREETLTRSLEEEKQLRANEAASHQEYVAGENRWISRLEDVAGRVTSQLATMGMPNVRYAPERSGTVNTKLTLFFEGVLGALAYLHSNRAATLAGEARRLCRGVMTKVLTKMAYWNPDLDFGAAMDSLPEGVDLTVLKERIKPVISCIDEIKRVEGQRRD